MTTEVDVEMRSLLAAASRGDQTAWDLIVRQFSSLLWSIARGFRLDPIDASDVVQMTWLRLVENLDRIAEPDALPAWLATTARRESLQLLRRTSRQRVIRQPEPLEMPDPGPPVDHTILLDERDAALWRKVAELGETCRRLLRVLMATPPPSYPEVSAALGVPTGSIGPTRQRCLRRLRQLIAADELLGDWRAAPDGGRRP
ncbi:MAG TPA: sigma-70 family RNA polymerase sigma factor [Actinophytocola sp.]|uniref:RNA polymerase sigma factor n=1 Tax=Actinophytocola sp. TaxID=1872138 RepID=UPI002DBC4400|nr:sigma-70 family RNA polymerase sigma factor [Actinophytocola sp.]HEU5469190.1 sigma-70 family RNA polymerase sigma factor [Actinophytocola sp.]